jgi:hypothetical protein
MMRRTNSAKEIKDKLQERAKRYSELEAEVERLRKIILFMNREESDKYTLVGYKCPLCKEILGVIDEHED